MYNLTFVLKCWLALSQTKKNEFMNEFLFDRKHFSSNDNFTTFLAKKFELFDDNKLPIKLYQ